MQNEFSPLWYETFSQPITRAHTENEVAFIRRHMPPSRFPRLLDLCCGRGRHSRSLLAAGYRVLGIDNNLDAINQARTSAQSHSSFQALDMRQLHCLEGTFNGIVNLWYSFGYFDGPTNAAILKAIYNKLRPEGRFIIDLYNRDAAKTLPEHEESPRGDIHFATRRHWRENRLRVEIAYSTGAVDSFEWELYTPSEFQELAASMGLRAILRCAWFDDDLPPSAEHLRMQFVCEKQQDHPL